MPDLPGLDFETYCEENIKAAGIYNYTEHPSFRPILASVVVDGVANSYNLLDTEERRDFAEKCTEFSLHYAGVAAHNAEFERLCLKKMGIDHLRVVDTAALARAAGASSSLALAAPQLDCGTKLPEGQDLIKKFCLPRPDGTALVDHREDWTDKDWDDWSLFCQYCEMDAQAAFRLSRAHFMRFFSEVILYEPITSKMNHRGWPVDLDLVEKFSAQAQSNKEIALQAFQSICDPNKSLNLNSHAQLKKWCRERGVLASSFDEQHVASMIERIEKKLPSCKSEDQLRKLTEVLSMLETKQILGGASLKKLPVIQRLTSADHRLRGQYMHIGAGQSFRTTGVGAQMQNLPRFNGAPGDLSSLHTWSNDELAHNLRQCFTASRPDGRLIVGDLSSIESRGLAYLAGEQWKTDAYCQGKDLYKVLASNIYSTPYDLITKQQRQTGKVGELSCGYGAGGGAVKSFADKMGVRLTEEAANTLVSDWRAQCPRTVALWDLLNETMHEALRTRLASRTRIGAFTYSDAIDVQIARTATPSTLLKINPHATSMRLTLYVNGKIFLTRIFHGCYYRGRDVCYYKASDRKTGPLWKDTFRDPKTKQLGYYKLYGGKLTGILVQSFCRELFFRGLSRAVNYEAEGFKLIGQFHDEIVVDWHPGSYTLVEAMGHLENAMTQEPWFKELPIEAEVKSDYRYTK